MCQKHFADILNIPSKKYGVTEFDASREISWDFKADSVDPGVYSVPANDAEGIANTIDNYGYYGIILAIGDIKFDDEETSFKKWHDDLRKEICEYETSRINRGIMSRTRKTAFSLEEIHFICFNSETLHKCCGMLQNSFENKGGRKLKPKEIIIDIRKIPNTPIVATEIFYGKVGYDSKSQYGIDC